MTADDLLRLTSKLSASPVAGVTARSDDLLTLLQAQEQHGRVTLYGSAHHGTTSFLVHSVLVKTEKLSGDLSRIVDWEGNPYDHPGCGLVTYGGKGSCVEMSDPWMERQPEPLLGATQLVFGRSFDGRLGGASYFELSHELTLRHGLHWLEEKHGWCRYDQSGEIAVLAGVEEAGNDDHGPSATLVWIDYDLLQRHMSASGMTLVQMFDAIPIPASLPVAGHNEAEQVFDPATGLIFRWGMSGAGSYARGVSFIGPNQTAQERGQSEASVEEAPKEYETFIVLDWKNGRVVDCSASPDAQASYFEKDSPLPFRANASWFQLKQPALIDRLHYPLTASTKIWDDTLIDMNKAINEGLNKDELKRIAIAGGSKGDPTMGSIKWLREALLAKGTDADQADDLVNPLAELQFLRTRFSAHAGGAGAAEERRKLLKEHGTPKQHIDSLAGRLVASLTDALAIFSA